MKRKLSALLALLLLLCFTGCSTESRRKETAELFEAHKAEFESAAEQVSETGEVPEGLAIDKVLQIAWFPPAVQFFIGGYTVGEKETYYGILYTQDDKPIGYQGTSMTFLPEGDGWRWQREGGEDWFYTERLVPHFFFFEIHIF